MAICATETSYTCVDLDGDGLLDLAVRPAPNVLSVRWNLGNGEVSDRFFVRSRGGGLYGATQPAFGDIDGDGDIDSVVPGGPGYPNEVVFNLGNRRFQLAPIGTIPADTATYTWGMSLADFDRDGDLDVLAWRDRTLPGLYVNDGTGKFTDQSRGRVPGVTLKDVFDVVIADVNGDGAPDAIVVEQLKVRLWVSGGSSLLTEVGVWSAVGAISALVGDLDGRHGVDIVVTGYTMRVLMQDATGQFKQEDWRMPVPRVDTGAALGDLDSDGDLDLAVGGAAGAYWNDGSGKFVARPLTWLYPNAAIPKITDAHWVDFDGDGDQDVVRAQRTHAQFDVWWNLERHAYTPRTATLGGQIKMELFGQPGDVFVPHVGVLERQQRIPGLGIWFLASPIVTLPVHRIPASKRLTYTIPLPNNPWLRGKKIIFQHAAVDLSGNPPKVRIMQRNPVTMR